jgi:hypothetical protein
MFVFRMMYGPVFCSKTCLAKRKHSGGGELGSPLISGLPNLSSSLILFFCQFRREHPEILLRRDKSSCQNMQAQSQFHLDYCGMLGAEAMDITLQQWSININININNIITLINANGKQQQQHMTCSL